MHRRACNRRLLAARGNRAGTVTKRGAQRTTPSPGEIPAGDNDRKASAAAEVMRSSRTSSTGGLLFDACYLLFTCRGKSLVPTTRRRWPISGWPPSIHFLWKRLSYHSPLPSPVNGLGDSPNRPQLRDDNATNVGSRLCPAGHIWRERPVRSFRRRFRSFRRRFHHCRRSLRFHRRRRACRSTSATAIRPPSAAARRWRAYPLRSCAAGGLR